MTARTITLRVMAVSLYVSMSMALWLRLRLRPKPPPPLVRFLFYLLPPLPVRLAELAAMDDETFLKIFPSEVTFDNKPTVFVKLLC